MSETKEMIINRLPAITWHRLNMNEARILYPGLFGECDLSIDCPDNVAMTLGKSSDDTVFSTFPAGMGPDADQLMKESAIKCYHFSIADDITASSVLRLNFSYHGHSSQAGYVEIDAGKNAELTVIMDYTSAEDTNGALFIQTKIRAAEDAKVNIIQIQRLGEKVMFLHDFSGTADQEADVKLIQLMLDGENSYHGVRFKLLGERANFNLDTGYRLKQTENLDINYVVEHHGPESTCDIQVNGVLRDTASKIFRGTIDLKRGAYNANGNEQENVLALDDEVINRSLPVILCGEENVQGNHGATMGRLDEDLLFYLESRGIEKKEVYEIMARARIEGVIRLIEDEPAREMLLQYVKGEDHAQGNS